MGIYKYKAKQATGGTDEGQIEAQSEKEAVEKLSLMGLIPIRIELKNAAPTQKELTSTRKSQRVKSKEITLFSRELASLLKSGVPILRALEIISEQSGSRVLKDALLDIRNSVKEGSTFSASLARYPRLFPPIYIAMVQAGEGGGALPSALLRISEYRAKQEEMISRIRMALAYPILMAIVGLGTVVFMFVFVVPRLMRIYVNMGQDLPLPTRILISISNIVQHSWIWIVLIIAVGLFIIKRESNTKAAKLSLSILKLRLPVLGNFILKAELARFCRTLELLIKNGIPILRAIEITIPVLENELVKSQLRQSHNELHQGGSFGKSLKRSKLFPPFMSNLIVVGEESGRLDEALSEVATSYESDTDEAVKVMGNLLEPLMILGMGLVVGFIVVAMLLPVFEMNVMAR